MRTKVVVLCALSIFIFSSNIFAQTTPRRTIKEKVIKGSTYILEQSSDGRDRIKNKDGKLDQLIKEVDGKCDYFYLTNQNSLISKKKEIVTSVFSAKRIRKLSSDYTNSFALLCVCNRIGEIKAVNFSRVKTDVITLQEIKALEDAFLKMKVSIDNQCPNSKYFRFSILVRFKDYL